MHGTSDGRRDRLAALALLACSETIFLWMFLSTDPLEQLARAGAIRSQDLDIEAAALRFAADWRHGMAGNSWLYMPGFFAMAGSLWLHARSAPLRRTIPEAVAACAIALLLAAAAAPSGARDAAEAFTALAVATLPHSPPPPSWAAAWRGLYTLLTWSVFVLASRHALITRTCRPFAMPAFMAVVLAYVRPWTVDDFVSLWRDRAAAGDVVACTSLAGVIALGALLAWSDCQGRWVRRESLFTE